MKYSDIRHQLKTGDIVLFSSDDFISKMIKWFTRSDWSHVGLVLNVKLYDFVLIWESTTLSNVNDVETGRPTKGVQLVQMSERINKYDGRVAVRRSRHFRPNANESLMDLRKELKGRPYERGENELFRSAYDGPFGENSPDLSSVFCSELVAEALKKLGL